MSDIVILVLIIIIITLILKQQVERKHTNKFIRVLEQIYHGNMNQRIRIRGANKEIKKLCEETNLVLDRFQDTFEQKKIMEESRKKMISNISHDLRTPLTALLGYIEVLQKDDTLSSEEREKYLQIVHSKGESLYELLEEFFQLSKLESDDVILKLERINICETVRESVLNYYEDFIKINITPDIRIPEEDLYVLAHKESIHRIMENLISNAIKYGTDGQKIGVELYKKKDYICINVWDNGKGISKEIIPYIFDRLYKGDKSRNKFKGGSGLGLTIVRKLVEKQNGYIKVISTPYEKTVFSFYIPQYKDAVYKAHKTMS
jgi:signal transduction histidine kinase